MREDRRGEGLSLGVADFKCYLQNKCFSLKGPRDVPVEVFNHLVLISAAFSYSYVGVQFMHFQIKSQGLAKKL